ncbi:LCP family protein [uncultured Clostridium sp.]|uniref:LCP family protein n=1 Tax=uncultured Clostridium sp. TaxID=59620 RepID=UPI00262EB8A3|nr:LCP family protein [uncultured Clostridium sp.]
MVRDDDNRGRKPKRRLSREEQIIMQRRIQERNKKIRRNAPRIGANDPRRRVDDDSINEELLRERSLYEEDDEQLLDEDYSEGESYSSDAKKRSNNGKSSKIRRSERKKKEKKSKRNSKNKKKKFKNSRVGLKKILGIIGLILIMFIGFNAISAFSMLSKITDENMMAAKPVAADETVNILLLGMDVGSVENPNDNSSKRTDTIMVLNFNPKTKKINLVSIPRDTKIDINGRSWKINAAYPIGGEKEITKQVENILGININYLAKIDYKAFRDIIDAIGGVTVKIKHDMDYTDKSQNLRIKFKKGTTEHLDGKKAEEFFRWRKNNDGTGLAMGDLDRIENQHEFLQAVVDKCTSPAIVLRLPSILKAIEKNVSTNMEGSTLIKYALKMIFVKSNNVNMTTIKGVPKDIGGQSYFIFEKEKNKDLLAELKNGTTENKGPESKGEISVKILNSTEVSGLAARYKTTLDREGFKKIDVGTIENNVSKNTYALVKSKDIKKIVEKDLIGIDEYKVMKDGDENSKYDLVVVLGLDSAG